MFDNNENLLKSRFIVILLDDGCLGELTEFFWEKHIVNVIFVHQPNTTHITTHTYFPFQYRKCNNYEPVLLHTWSILESSKILIPSDINFFPNKIQNMQKCEVKVALFEDPPSIMLHSIKTGQYELHGKDSYLLKFFASRMNFTLEVVVPENEWASISRSGNNITGTLKLVAEGQAQMTIGTFVPTPTLLKLFTRSKTIAEQKLIWVIPIKDRLGPIERLLNPISNVVWIVLIIFVAIILVIALILSYCIKDKSYKNFIIGRCVDAPLLNIFGMFLGISVYNLPKRNFARFLLMSWMLLTFFFRMMYEANLISAMTSQKPEKMYNTLSELHKAGFKFLLYDIFYEFLNVIKDKNRIIIIDHLNQYSFVPYFQDPDPNKLYAILAFHSKLLYFNKEINMSLPFYVSKERFLAFPKSIYFHKTSVISEEINLNIKVLRDNGLLIKWRNSVIDDHFSKYTFRKKVDALGMKHLSGGFYLLVGGLVLACVTFIAEVTRNNWTKRQKNQTHNRKSITLN